ncbi:MAG: PorP/SprF family type IX secretion system membrane protein [Bacteroidetes bacterium]|nr:PorP/SprF family type IX secretion system membrane protein [Bacteroidota bacterium]
MKKILYISFFCITSKIIAQDTHFSQLAQQPLLINPANAGFFDGYARAIANYRTQWNAGGAPFQTIMVSFDANAGLKKSKKAYLGLGGYVYQDFAGTSGTSYKTFNANMVGNAIVNIGAKSQLSGALMLGMGQTSTNNNNYSFGVQYTGNQFNTNLPNFENLNTNRHYNWFDLSSGINYEFNKIKGDFSYDNRFSLKVGFAGYHLNNPQLEFTTNNKQPIGRRFVASSQARIDIKESPISILPSVIYMFQGPYRELNIGTFARYRFKDATKTTGLKSEVALSLGFYYRTGDALIPQFLVEFKSLSFGFSYDQTISTYKNANRGLGAFEVSLSWRNLRNGLYNQRREYNSGSKNVMTPN